MDNKVIVPMAAQKGIRPNNARRGNDPEAFEDDFLDDEEIERPRGKNLKKFKHSD